MPTRASTKKSTAAKKTAPSKAKATKASTSKKAAAPKAATSVTAAAKAALAGASPMVPATVTKLEPIVSGPALRKKELIDTVTADTGLKRADVKKVVEATLASMGRALQDSRGINAQPFGTLKLQRERKLPEGRVVVARIRQARDLPAEPEATPEADAKTAAE